MTSMGSKGTVVTALVIAALAAAGCGDEESPATTESTPVESTASASTSTSSTAEPSSTTDATSTSTSIPTTESTSTSGGSSGGVAPEDVAAGEIADLPLCSDAPPPCRQGNRAIEP